MPLVEFIQNHNAALRQIRAAQQSLRQNAFGEIPQLGSRTANLLEADLKSDGLANGFAHLLRHAAGRHASRQSARLEHINLFESGLE